jgi:hypothetical protein
MGDEEGAIRGHHVGDGLVCGAAGGMIPQQPIALRLFLIPG